MSHRSFRSTLVPVASGLVAVVAVSGLAGIIGMVPAHASADYGVAGTGIPLGAFVGQVSDTYGCLLLNEATCLPRPTAPTAMTPR